MSGEPKAGRPAGCRDMLDETRRLLVLTEAEGIEGARIIEAGRGCRGGETLPPPALPPDPDAA